MPYVAATLLLIANLVAWASTLFGLPGNWFVVLLAAAYAWLMHDSSPHLSWTAVAVAGGLAVLGEVVETFAGVPGVKRLGGSRRGMLLSVVGTIVGSLAGAAVGVPLPVIGSLVGAVGGGALGAFVGAYLGEVSAGRLHSDRMQIGKAAVVGRLWGTAGKLVLGIVMVILVAADSLFDRTQ